MSPRSDTTAIVLAGGRSTRFGGPKLAAELAGRPLIDHALRAVGAVTDTIIVVGSPSPIATAVAPGPSIRAIPDDEPFAGPLAALAGALRDTNTELAVVVGGDMPGLVPRVLEAMVDRLLANQDVDAAILAGPAGERERRQVLPLAVRVGKASTAAAEALEAGDRSLVRMLDRLRAIEILAADWLVHDPAGRTLLDVDRPEDLERIQQNFR